MRELDARGLISLLYHGDKAMDVLAASLELDLLRRLDTGPISLAALCAASGARPGRLYKLLDCLESLGLVERHDAGDELLETSYRSREPLHDAALAVLGPASIERGRDSQPGWREIHGRLPAVLRGEHGISEAAFSYPPRTPEQVAGFEHSMALGCAAIAESFLAAGDALWQGLPRPLRLLDVGGGDGTLARRLAEAHPWLAADVFNLPGVAPLFERQREASPARERLGFRAGDFFAAPLPTGYDALAFVRVLHDFSAASARRLLVAAFAALPPGGRLFVCEELRTPARLAVQFFWSYFLVGVDSCVSRLREPEAYQRVLAEIGFVDVRLVPGAFDVLVATRP